MKIRKNTVTMILLLSFLINAFYPVSSYSCTAMNSTRSVVFAGSAPTDIMLMAEQSVSSGSAVVPEQTIQPVMTPVPDASSGSGAVAEPVITFDPDALTEDELRTADEFKRKKVKGIKLKKNIENSVVIKWKKVTSAACYKVYRANNKDGIYKAITITDKHRFKDKNAKKRKKYNYIVKAVLNIKNNNFFSRSSKNISVYVMPKKPRVVIAGECFVEDFAYQSSAFPSNYHLVYKIGVNTYTMIHNNYFDNDGYLVTGIEKIATYRPDRVYFLIGANESAWQKPDWTMTNFKYMFGLLKKINRNVQIVLIAVPPFGVTSTQNIPSPERRAEYNRAYMEYADTHNNIFFCDATYVLQDPSGYLSGSYDGGDGCHWNTTGTSEVIKALKKWSRDTFDSW